jgi:hypothetical protein
VGEEAENEMFNKIVPFVPGVLPDVSGGSARLFSKEQLPSLRTVAPNSFDVTLHAPLSKTSNPLKRPTLSEFSCYIHGRLIRHRNINC